MWEFLAARDGALIEAGVKPRGTRDISEEELAEMGIAGF